jgi:hypothetical protein
MIWGHRRSQQAIAERRYLCFPPLGSGGVSDSSELFRENQWARLHLIPLMNAENDRHSR